MEKLAMTAFERPIKLSTPPLSLASIFLDIAAVASVIPAQIRSQATGYRARLLASIMTMNLLWGVWMIFIEHVVVGMQWTAVTDLRLSALLWNTVAAVVWTGHIEHGMSALWHITPRHRINASDGTGPRWLSPSSPRCLSKSSSMFRQSSLVTRSGAR